MNYFFFEKYLHGHLALTHRKKSGVRFLPLTFLQEDYSLPT